MLFGLDIDKLQEGGDLISRGGMVLFDNFETFFVAVEKYLPDYAVLSTTDVVCTSYITENKGIVYLIFKIIVQSI